MMKRAVVLNVVKPEYRRSLPFDEQTMVFYPKPSLASQNKGPSGRLFDPVDNISTDEEDEPEFKIGRHRRDGIANTQKASRDLQLY